jgi:hypothetical protein
VHHGLRHFFAILDSALGKGLLFSRGRFTPTSRTATQTAAYRLQGWRAPKFHAHETADAPPLAHPRWPGICRAGPVGGPSELRPLRPHRLTADRKRQAGTASNVGPGGPTPALRPDALGAQTVFRPRLLPGTGASSAPAGDPLLCRRGSLGAQCYRNPRSRLLDGLSLPLSERRPSGAARFLHLPPSSLIATPSRADVTLQSGRSALRIRPAPA